MLNNGDLFYLLTVVPEREVGTYGQAFDRVVQIGSDQRSVGKSRLKGPEVKTPGPLIASTT